MGFLDLVKKIFFVEETTQEYEYGQYEELHDWVYDSEETDDSVPFAGKKGKKETQKEPKKKRNAQEEKQHLKTEEEKYDKLLNSVHAQELNKVLKLPQEKIKMGLTEEVFLDNYNREDVAAYVKSQCDIMEEAAGYIDLAREQYEVVAEHFSDIELYEDAPEGIKSKIAIEAERVDNLTVDRRIFKASENKLSNNAYHRMEMYEDEIPKSIRFIENQENEYESVRHDMRMLEGEQMALRLDARGLRRRQFHIKSAAFATLVCLAAVFSIFVIAMVSAGEDNFNTTLFFVVTALSAVLALGMLYILQSTHRKVVVTEIRLNKATNMLNKMKIKYVNAANVLDYEYEKFKIKSAYELAGRYQIYLEMKEEQKNILEMTAKLTEAEERLIELLKRLGMKDSAIWVSQVRALYNHNEMVEVRHDLSVQRQKLRGRIAYNEKKISEAKKNIKEVTQKYPGFTNDTLKILDEYERRNRKG